MKKWFAVHTKPRKESQAEDNLDRQGYEIYYPRIKQFRRRGGKWQHVAEALFPRYLFIHLAIGEDSLAPIRSTLGVSGLVRFGADPVPLSTGFVDVLRSQADELTGIHYDHEPLFKQGDQVRIQKGALSGLTGIFQAATGDERVIILMTMMGQEQTIKLERDEVALA